MIYAPHKLQRRVTVEPQKDEFGRIIHTGGYTWEDICACRCDDNDTMSFQSDNGSAYTPKYHIVCDGKRALEAGDYVRCLDGDKVRGEGEIYRLKGFNLMPYTEVWI